MPSSRVVSSVIVYCAIAVGVFVAFEYSCSSEVKLKPKLGLRLATYNVEWLSENMSDERASRLRSVTENLDADIIAFQEIESRRALEEFLGDEWQISMADDPNAYQELAVAVRRPLSVSETPEELFADAAFEFAFPGERNLLRVRVAAPNGFELSVYCVHFKSRGGGRVQTDPRRQMAASLIAAYIRGRNETFVAVLGDFNDTPDDVSLNILESGNLLASAGSHSSDDGLLINVTDQLASKDYVTYGLNSLYRGAPIIPRVQGAQVENEKWRGKEYRYPQDLAVTQAFFDQILLSPALADVIAGTPDVYAMPDALEGTEGEVERTDGGLVSYVRQGSLASDHLPVYVDVRVETF